MLVRDHWVVHARSALHCISLLGESEIWPLTWAVWTRSFGGQISLLGRSYWQDQPWKLSRDGMSLYTLSCYIIGYGAYLLSASFISPPAVWRHARSYWNRRNVDKWKLWIQLTFGDESGWWGTRSEPSVQFFFKSSKYINKQTNKNTSFQMLLIHPPPVIQPCSCFIQFHCAFQIYDLVPTSERFTWP